MASVFLFSDAPLRPQPRASAAGPARAPPPACALGAANGGAASSPASASREDPAGPGGGAGPGTWRPRPPFSQDCEAQRGRRAGDMAGFLPALALCGTLLPVMDALEGEFVTSPSGGPMEKAPAKRRPCLLASAAAGA